MIPQSSTRVIVTVVMVSHFVAAVAALGMPPFFTLILERSLHTDAGFLAGWLYVVPTLFVALSSPWWGRLADRFGKKPLLMRAQLGLSASFLLAGFAPNLWVFVLALALQGILGGTFGASNAYLASVVSGNTLTRSLTAMQWSARAALVVAPAGLGAAVGVASPIELYRYLACLPLLAAVLIWMLPDPSHGVNRIHAPAPSPTVTDVSPLQVYLLQFMFVFATVATYPYFVADMQHRFPQLAGTWLGVLFGVPHLAYLVLALPLSRWLVAHRPMRSLGIAFAALTLSLAGQIASSTLEVLLLWRVVMGAAMTASFISLHALMASLSHASYAGRLFGRAESSSKWGAVTAGLCAGVVADVAGVAAPFAVGASVMAVALGFIVLTAGWRRSLSPS